MEFIDTHAHLDDERFAGDLEAVLQRARDAGLVHIVAVATSLASTEQCLRLAQLHPLLRPSVGIHPNHIATEPPHAWERILELAAMPGVVALGETGLDRHWDDTPFDVQEDYFARHLALSRATGLPIIIHCRDCEDDMVRVLRAEYEREGPIHGVMHSFSATSATARSCLEMGLHISFAGMLTYKNAHTLREVASELPLDRLLIETDSPYLAPVPQRGQRNEPAFVVHTAQVLAQVKGVSLKDLAEHSTRNARELFRLA